MHWKKLWDLIPALNHQAKCKCTAWYSMWHIRLSNTFSFSLITALRYIKGTVPGSVNIPFLTAFTPEGTLSPSAGTDALHRARPLVKVIMSNRVPHAVTVRMVYSNYFHVLFKMFSRWFFINKNLIIRSIALKFCAVTDDIMTQYFMWCLMHYATHDYGNTHCPQRFTENVVGSLF